MKKLIFTIFALTFTWSLCFAQSDMEETPTKTITGNVALVIVDDAIKGIKPEIVIVNEKGKMLRFAVREKTSITNRDGEKLRLIDINKDSKVTIDYITRPKGVQVAISIKLK